MDKKKTIGVLTSGGDAPGMNAAVRAVVRTAIYNGMRVIGIYKGYNGLMSKNFKELDARSVGNIITQGGTMLYSARSKEFEKIEGVRKGIANLKEAGIEGLVTIGGDGTFRGARDLSLEGMPCIGIPGTIDNDISSTEFSIGFDTALNTAIDNIDKIRDTSESHDRCAVVEVMGRHCGALALHAGISCGAEAILTPEIPFDVDRDIIDVILRLKETGKSNFTIVTAEGVTAFSSDPNMNVHALAKYIEEKTGVESRGAILGHMQRGGTPTGRDRVMASEMGSVAVNLLSKGLGNRVIAIQKNQVVDFDILEALEMKKDLDPDLVKIAKEIAI